LFALHFQLGRRQASKASIDSFLCALTLQIIFLSRIHSKNIFRKCWRKRRHRKKVTSSNISGLFAI